MLIQDISSASLSQKRKEQLQAPTKAPLRKKAEATDEIREEKAERHTIISVKMTKTIPMIKTKRMEITKGNSVGVETETSTSRTRTVKMPNGPEETRKKVEITSKRETLRPLAHQSATVEVRGAREVRT